MRSGGDEAGMSPLAAPAAAGPRNPRHRRSRAIGSGPRSRKYPCLLLDFAEVDEIELEQHLLLPCLGG